MQVSVETTSAVERRMTIGVPSAHLAPKIQNRLKSLVRQTKISGFRPGKVPLRLIEEKYGKKVREEILGEVLQDSFKEAVAQEKLHPIGDPSYDLNSDIKNLEQGLSYTATFEVYPDIPTLHVEGLAVEMPVCEITESDIETMLQRLQKQRQTWNEVERPAQEGDRVILDFFGLKDGKAFKGNEFKQVPLILEKNNVVIPGLNEKLLGVTAGSDREGDLTFPEDHTNSEIAGQTVHFVVHVHSIAEPQLPEINAEFAQSFGVEEGNIETFRRDARQNMERELEYAVKEKLKQQVLNALLEANLIEVPKSLVAEEAERLYKTRVKEWQSPNLSADMFKDEAVTRVKIGLLIGELIRKYKIYAPNDKVKQMVERIAFAYDDPDAVVKEYYADSERLKEVESIVLENEVVDWLLERAQITEKQSDFYNTVMAPH
ncbi:MAG: trigger factor [Candidatus Parabeggiatoa sp. nov. 3]|nr:MAG: trigger factor [Gammaproteobacteria bacterium]RKZ65025.1 MAG: trigger factor [Gammaproteobacteria bacterium]RKZ83537.1 MAG: trigger factor [Gammaproteobacteria bacterium]